MVTSGKIFRPGGQKRKSKAWKTFGHFVNFFLTAITLSNNSISETNSQLPECFKQFSNFVLSFQIFYWYFLPNTFLSDILALHGRNFGQLATPAAALAVVAHPTP